MFFEVELCNMRQVFNHASFLYFAIWPFLCEIKIFLNPFLRVVLSQAKQKTPLILPGFEAIDNPDDFSGQYTVCVQYVLDTKDGFPPLVLKAYDLLSE